MEDYQWVKDEIESYLQPKLSEEANQVGQHPSKLYQKETEENV